MNPDHPGSHLHGPQVRPVARVKQLNGTSLYDGYKMYRDDEGFYFQVIAYNNGYNGRVDSMPFFQKDSDAIEVLVNTEPGPKQKSVLQWLWSFLRASGD